MKKRRENDSEIYEKAQEIVKKVRKEGDCAALYFTEKFDSIKLKELRASAEEIEKAVGEVSEKKLKALELAGKRIADFSESQKPKSWSKEFGEGIILGELVKPLDCVGVYAPADRFPLASSVLMCAVPAKTAGCKKIILCTPPQKNGKISPSIAAAAKLCGINEIYKIGGAQAIAAMAFGTESIPRVDKIVGPGNRFVAAAKRVVSAETSIDMNAGPSEIVVLAGRGNPEWIALDLLAQAEHGADSLAVLVACSEKLAGKVIAALEKTAGKNSELLSRTMVVLEKDLNNAIALVNEIAPEHLEVFGFGEEVLDRVSNSGAIFFGEHSCVALGDYCAGGNHVLPTAGFARSRGGLSTRDFVKAIAFQKVSEKGFSGISECSAGIAEMEGMKFHRKSIEARRNENGKNKQKY